MVNHDVSDTHRGIPPGTLLVARLHVDLCRLAGAACLRCATAHD